MYVIPNIVYLYIYNISYMDIIMKEYRIRYDIIYICKYCIHIIYYMDIIMIEYHISIDLVFSCSCKKCIVYIDTNTQL